MSADIEAFGARTLVVCSADHVFNMDLAPVIDEHVASGRSATVLTSEVTKKDASDNVVVLARRDGTVTGVEHKPSRPSAGTVATEIFVYDTEVLLDDAARPARRAGGQDAEDARRRQRHRRLRRAPAAAARREREGRRRAAHRLLARRRPARPLPAVPPRPAGRQGRRLRPPRPSGHLALARPSRRARARRGGVPRLAAVAGRGRQRPRRRAACSGPASWSRRAPRSTTAS